MWHGKHLASLNALAACNPYMYECAYFIWSHAYTYTDLCEYTHSILYIAAYSVLEGQLWVEAFVLGMTCLFGPWHPDEH